MLGSQVPVPALLGALPRFRHAIIAPLPKSGNDISRLALRRGSIMGTSEDHRRHAEECVAMAQLADDDGDKALWLTLAQSWVRLAEHVARGPLRLLGETGETAASVDHD
jgi:hypothetical protein